MKTTCKDILTNRLDNIKKNLLMKIAACCLNSKFALEGNILLIGNTCIRYDMETEKVLISTERTFYLVDWRDKSKWIEIDSDDGYPSLEDLAHWADTCEDYIECREAGNDKYSVAWNVEQNG